MSTLVVQELLSFGTAIITLIYFYFFFRTVQDPLKYQSTLVTFFAIILPTQVLIGIWRGLLWFIGYLQTIILGTIVFSFIAFLYGATIDTNLPLWALLVTLLIIVPHVNFHIRSYRRISIGIGLAIVWASAFVIPLDWDRPWQVWPICCTYGVVIGCIVSVLLSPLFKLRGWDPFTS